MSFIAALDAELEALHNVLAADPTFVKWRELQRIRGLYSQAYADVVLSEPGGTIIGQSKQGPPLTEGDGTTRGRRGDPERARAIEEAARFVGTFAGVPVPNVDVFNHLIDIGVSIPGEKPINNLSAMMSNSRLFQANGRKGWTLRLGADDTDLSAEDVREKGPSPDDLRDAAFDIEAGQHE